MAFPIIEGMWQARTKADLIIEVWEKLDCESVGAKELIAIEEAVRERFGPAAVDSPMVLARTLADEGAELRHSEIMELYVQRRADRPYEPVLRNVVKLGSLKTSLSTIRDLENIRKKFASDDDKEGLRLLRATVLDGKQQLLQRPTAGFSMRMSAVERAEVADWLTLWLQTPEMFETWFSLRKRSKEFIEKFGSGFGD